MNNYLQDLKLQIKARAARLGFPLCGVTDPQPPVEYSRYTDWLAKGYHAGMAYLDTEYHRSVRKDSARLFPSVRSIIVLGFPYRLTTQHEMDQTGAGVICGYAVGEDYHQRIPRLLEPLVEFLHESSPDDIRPRVFTDSAPILERELASRAGLGWIGRNTCLISPSLGSALLLAEIFTDLPLEPDTPEKRDLCGTCDRCIGACPTACILPDRMIDANRCISYHSIENKGEIPADLAARFTNQVFGCDICQVVCPWNRFSPATEPRQGSENLIPVKELAELLEISQPVFDERFAETPVARLKKDGFTRNLYIVSEKLHSKNRD